MSSRDVWVTFKVRFTRVGLDMGNLNDFIHKV